MRFGVGLTLLLASFLAPASTNNAWFVREWKTDDGLINNNIVAAAQGADGYLWVAPTVGLMRFDGIRFSRYPIEDLTGPIDNHIGAMLCGKTGVLWIATFGGQVIGLNPDFSVVKLPPSDLLPKAMPGLAEGQDGSLWLCYANAIYQIKNGQVARFGLNEKMPAGIFHALISDGAGNIWMAKGNQVCVFRNGQFQRVAIAHNIRSLAATPTNAVWFVAGNHLWACDADGALKDRGVFPGLSRATGGALHEDHSGAVWIGTDGNGLIRYGQSGFEKVETPYSSILSLAEDPEGNLWAGTGGGGLDRVSLSGVRLETLGDNPVSERIESIDEDTNGNLWGSTYNGMLAERVDGEWTLVFTNAAFSGTVRCVAADRDGGIWIGTHRGELIDAQPGELLRLLGTNCTTMARTAVAGPLSTLFQAKSGDLWLMGRSTLECWHAGHLHEVKLPQPVNRFSAITEDINSNIWVGARGTVFRIAKGESQETNLEWLVTDESPHLPIAGRAICCLYGTSDGSVWISCSGLGLLRFKAGRVSQAGVGQGLFNDYIAQIATDDCGWFWFSSDHGIFKIRQHELEQAMNDPRALLHPIVYGRNESLAGLEARFSTGPPFVFPRALRTHDGRVWLLTNTGLVVADPKLLPEHITTSALLTQVAMDGKTIASYGSVTSTQTVANLKTVKAPLQLPPSHRHLEFDFTGFHFSAPENIRFRYQLAGFDNGWIDADTARSANYSRLSAGDYQFRVIACVGDGPWSQTPAALPFTVAPFFWQTWWFRLVALSLFSSAIIVIVRYISFRRLQVKIRLVEQHAALDRERARIARDLHDDLGGSLNLAALTLDLTQSESGMGETLNGKIQYCSTIVRRAARSVDEIVWAINPRNDTLRYLVDYLSQFTVEFLHAADILCTVELPDSIPDRNVKPEVRHNLFLVVKEALNNIVRHANTDEVGLRVTVSESQLAISIRDNGRGFERPPDNASCDGLNNMRHRMEDIGGQFQLDSRSGAGTHIILLYPLSPSG